MLSGFKEFIARGNAIDLAVGVIIGAAFTSVVDAIVNSVFNPLIGALFGQPNFDSLLSFEIQGFGEPAVVSFGAVLSALLNFLIVAIALYFCIVLPLNKIAEIRAAKDEDPEEVELSQEAALLVEIRDALQRSAKE